MKVAKLISNILIASLLFACAVTQPCFGQETGDKEKAVTQEKQYAKSAQQDKEKEPEPIVVEVADGNIRFKASGTWKVVKPASRIVEFEIAVPKLEGDPKDGRLTIMGAGGTVEENIERWQGQFKQTGEEEKSVVKKEKINEQDVTFVDMTGTFIDSPGGPFAGGAKVERPGYRMLAAIIETKDDGKYFVKLYGPKKTMKENEKHFMAMIKSVNVAD